jgi:hypothetical protein
MLEPNNRLDALVPAPLKRESSPEEKVEEYLLPRKSPEPPDTPLPQQAPRRRSSILRHAADALTHPGRNFRLPHLATRNAAHAEELVAVYCGRLCEWGLATLEQASPEARLLQELQTLNVLLQSSAQARAADPSNFETEAHASAVLSLTREVIHAKDSIQGFRLSFEVDGHLYDIVEVVQCLHGAAVSTLLGLFLST